MVNKEKQKPKEIKLSKDQTVQFYRSKEQELKNVVSRIKEVNSLINDIKKAEDVLHTMGKLKSKEKLLINIGVGILIECEIANNESAKITLPGNIVLDKKVSLILEDINKRKEELEKTKKELTKLYMKTLKTLQAVSKALEQIEMKQNLKSESAPSVS